jgi:hypothetical protein
MIFHTAEFSGSPSEYQWSPPFNGAQWVPFFQAFEGAHGF